MHNHHCGLLRSLKDHVRLNVSFFIRLMKQPSWRNGTSMSAGLNGNAQLNALAHSFHPDHRRTSQKELRLFQVIPVTVKVFETSGLEIVNQYLNLHCFDGQLMLKMIIKVINDYTNTISPLLPPSAFWWIVLSADIMFGVLPWCHPATDALAVAALPHWLTSAWWKENNAHVRENDAAERRHLARLEPKYDLFSFFNWPQMAKIENKHFYSFGCLLKTQGSCNCCTFLHC